MPIARTVESFLAEYRVPYAIINHPRSLSSRETAEAATVPVAQIAKPVILGDGRGYVMAVVPGDHEVEIERLSQQLGRPLRLVEEPDLAPLFEDCETGAMPPIGLAYGMETVVDDSLLEQEKVCFVAGDHDRLVCVDRETFRRLIGGAVRAPIARLPRPRRTGGGQGAPAARAATGRAAAVEVFAHTLENTGEWLDEIVRETGWDVRRAYSALRAVLHAVRDRLMLEEAIDLGAQLPLLVRGLYYDGWRPTAHPRRYRHTGGFLQHLAELYPGLEEDEREVAMQAVFKVLARHVTGGEMAHVWNQLPAEVRSAGETSVYRPPL